MKKRLNQLTELTSLQMTDLVYVERVAGAVATGYKAQASNLPGGFGYFVAINGGTLEAPYDAPLDETSTVGTLGTWTSGNLWTAPATGLYLAHFRAAIDGTATGFVYLKLDSSASYSTINLADLSDSAEIQMTALVPMTAGQTLNVHIDLDTGIIADGLGMRFTVVRLA